MPREPTLAMGGAGGELLAPPEAPQGTARPLTAEAVTLQHHVDRMPL
jgi:hypothetical protein